GLLGDVRVRLAGVHLAATDATAPHAGLGQHAPDGVLQNADGVLGEHLARGGLPKAALVSGVAAVDLLVELTAGELHLLGVDDDDEVTAWLVRRVSGLVLALQHGSDLSSEPSDPLAGGVNDDPVVVELGWKVSLQGSHVLASALSV